MTRAAVIAALLACGCTRAPEQANAPSVPVSPAEPAAPASDAPAPAPASDAPPTPAPPETAVEAKAAPAPAGPRACEFGERLDTGCECRSGACFDICCGENVGCAHPGEPGGPSACILKMPVAPPKQPRACKDGEALADGCRCDGKTCMDICCVGSACSHHASPDGGWAKCMKVPKHGR